MPDKRGNSAVGLVVVFLVGKFLELSQERYRVPRGKQCQQVRRKKLSHCSPRKEKLKTIQLKPRTTLNRSPAYFKQLRWVNG